MLNLICVKSIDAKSISISSIYRTYRSSASGFPINVLRINLSDVIDHTIGRFGKCLPEMPFGTLSAGVLNTLKEYTAFFNFIHREATMLSTRINQPNYCDGWQLL